VWEVRANGYYYPNQGKNTLQDLGLTEARISDNNIVFTHSYAVEQVYNGMDMEVGRSVIKNLKGYAAYYNYENEITGGRLRLTYDINDRLQLVGSSQYDDVRGWQTMAGVRYTLGKSLAKTGTIQDKLYAPVVRDMTVPVKTLPNYNEDEVDTTVKVYVAQGDVTQGLGNGSFANPMTLNEALAASHEGDIIYLLDGEYDITAPITLKENQTLWGSGSDLEYNGFLLKAGTDAQRPLLRVNNTTGTSWTTCETTRSCAIHVTQTSSYGGFELEEVNTGGTQVFNGLYINTGLNEAISLTDLKIHGFANGNGIFAEGGTLIASDIHSHDNRRGIRFNTRATTDYLELTGSQFNDNTIDGVFIDGRNSEINTIAYQISNTSMQGKLEAGSDSLTVWDTNVSVSESQIKGTEDGLRRALFFAGGGMVILNNMEKIEGRIYVAESERNNTVLTINNPTYFVGDFSLTSSDLYSHVTVNYKDSQGQEAPPFHPTDINGASCGISGGVGSCSNPPPY
jgi:hypothetical protein